MATAKDHLTNTLKAMINGDHDEAQSQLHSALQIKMQAVIAPKSEEDEDDNVDFDDDDLSSFGDDE